MEVLFVIIFIIAVICLFAIRNIRKELSQNEFKKPETSKPHLEQKLPIKKEKPRKRVPRPKKELPTAKNKSQKSRSHSKKRLPIQKEETCESLAKKYYDTALQKTEESDYKAVIRYCTLALQQETQGFYFDSRAFAQVQIGNYNEAISDYDKAIDLNPNIASYWLCRGLAYMGTGDKQFALRNWIKAKELGSESAKNLLGEHINDLIEIAEAKINKKEYESAISYYNLILEEKEEDSSFGNRGFAKLMTGDYIGAKEDYDKAIELSKEENELYFRYRGGANLKLENYQESIKDYGKAIDLSTVESELYFSRRGLARLKIQDYGGGIKDYDKAIELSKEEKESYFKNRGIAKYRIDDYKGTVRDFDKAIELAKEEKESYFVYGGLAKFVIKDYEGAIRYYDKAIGLTKEEKEFYFGIRGETKFKIEDYSGAIKDYNKAIALSDENNEEYFGNRAFARYKTEDYDGAIRDYDKALVLNPQKIASWRVQGSAYYNKGIKKTARLNWTKAYELGSSKAEKFLKEYGTSIQINDFESDTSYPIEIKSKYNLKRKNFSFDDIRQVSIDFNRSLSEAEGNRLWESLEQGVAILETCSQLKQYLYAYGKMHKAKLNESFDVLDYLPNGQRIDIIDYGCGQGIGTVLLMDYLKKQSNADFSVSSVTLIEPSIKALKRAALNVFYSLKSINNETVIYSIAKRMEELEHADVHTNKECVKFHIFSNILDVEGFCIDTLASKIENTQEGENYFICVSPNIVFFRNERLDQFYEYFDNSTLISSRNCNIGSYKRYEKVFAVNF